MGRMIRLAAALTAALAACGGGGGGGGGGTGGGGPGGHPPVDLSGPQLGQLSIDLASGEVAVTAQPQALVLSGSAVYDAGAGTVVLSLSVLNHSTAVLASPKVIFGGLTEGAVTGDGTFGTATFGPFPYVYYGPESLVPEAAVARDVLIEGVGGASPTLGISVEIRRHPWIFFSSAWDDVSAADSSGCGEALSVDVHAFSFKDEDALFRPEASSADGRFVRFAARNQPAVGTLDLSDLSFSLGSSLVEGEIAFDGGGAVGSIDGLTPAGGFLYAVVNARAHSFRASMNYPPPDVHLVKLDAEDLSVVGDLLVLPSTEIEPKGPPDGAYIPYRGRKLSISADGKRGALAITDLGLVFLLDLTTLSVIDADPVEPGKQGFDLSPGSKRVRFAALAPDGTAIYAAIQGGDGTLDVIDVASGAVTPLAPPSPVGPVYPGFLTFGPDGRLYYGRTLDLEATPGLSIYDPAAGSWSVPEGVTDAFGIDFTAEAYCVYDFAAHAVVCFALADDAALPAEATGAAAIPAAGGDFGHGVVVTRE